MKAGQEQKRTAAVSMLCLLGCQVINSVIQLYFFTEGNLVCSNGLLAPIANNCSDSVQSVVQKW